MRRDSRSEEAKKWRRWYGLKAWLSIREARKAAEPLCRMCTEAGRVTVMHSVDHVIPHKGDPELFFNLENTQSLCEPCHVIVKQREERRGYAAGCDIAGLPIASDHHWMK